MLLTIHNLPSSTRYADVKTLLQEKCGLTEVIVDNLVNEGKNKKVTVGLASEDDGAFVVRKLNGLFINGQQLYIEDRRRPSADQPYRQSSFEPDSNTTMQPAMAPPAVWNQNVAVPYMPQMPVDQNFLAYSGYGGAPQTTHYMEPQPVSAEIPRYSGHPVEPHAPNKPPRNQESGDWGRKSRDQVPGVSQHKDRKRRHSPERPAPSKRLSRLDNYNKAKNRREPSPPRQQWAENNRAFQVQFSSQDQNVEPAYQPKETNSDYQHKDPVWEQPRWDEPNPREREQQRANNNRNWEPQPAKVWDNQPQQRRDEPRQWDNQPKPQWESPPRPQWDNQPKPQWESPTKPQWDHQPNRDWDGPHKSQWDNQHKPQWDSQPNPQWDDRMPVDNIRSEWYDHLASSETSRGNEQNLQPQDRDRYDSRSRNKGYNEPITDRIWSREAERSFNSSGRQESRAEVNRDRPRSRNGRQGRDDWRDRPVASRDRSGGRQQKPDYGKPKEYPSREFKRQTRLPERPERDAPKAVPRHEIPRHDRNEMYRQNANKNRFAQEKITYPPVQEKKSYPTAQEKKQYPNVQEKKQYPPVSKPAVKKLVEVRFDTKKPQTLRSMINKDQSNRYQATSLLAKMVYGIETNMPFHPKSPQDTFIFKKLKECIKSRIDVLFGEELSVHIDDVVKRYRSKYPIDGDKILNVQIREKSTREFELLPPRQPKEKVLKDEATSVIQVKKEKEDAARNNGEKENSTTENQEATPNDKGQTTAAAANKPTGPPLPPSMAKRKPGQPLTDKQVIQQMKLLRKWEYDQDDLYSLDEMKTKALDDEMAELDKLFTEECSNPADQQEALICKRIATDSLNDFNKTIRLYISKRFLNIQTGLAVRMFSSGKPPKKTAVLEYLKKHKVQASAVKKSVKGFMYMINLAKFADFDKLCNIDNDVIDGIPVNFRALHLIGPPPTIRKNHIKAMRQKLINNQIDGVDADELEDVDFGDAGDEAETGDDVETGDAGNGDMGNEDMGNEDMRNEDIGNVDTGDAQEDFTKDDFADFAKDFGEEVNIDNIKEEDLEDF